LSLAIKEGTQFSDGILERSAEKNISPSGMKMESAKAEKFLIYANYYLVMKRMPMVWMDHVARIVVR
jgi:hypothetical protein